MSPWKNLSFVLAIFAVGTVHSAPQQEIVLNSADKAAEVTVELPALPAVSASAVLSFDARTVAKPNSGWSHALGINVNGFALAEYKLDGARRLFDRSDKIQLKKGTLAYCRPWRGGPKWLLFSGPENSAEVDSRIVSDRQYGYTYKLDVSDLVQPGKPTVVKFIYPIVTADLKGGKTTVKIKNISLTADGKKQPLPPRTYKYPAAFEQPLSAVIPTGERKPQAVTLKFPAVKVPRGTVPVLFFNARIVTAGFSGWNPFIALSLNGKKIERLTASGRARLLYRGNILKTSLPGKKELDYFQNMRGRMSLMTFFAPVGTEKMDPRVMSDQQHGYDYCLDVSDILNRYEIGADGRVEQDSPNEFTIQFQLVYADTKNQNLPLAVRDINILFVPQEEIIKASQAAMTKLESAPAAARLAAQDGSRLEVGKCGTIKVASGKEFFFVNTRISYPAKPVMKYNVVGFNRSGSEKSWTVSVKQLSKDSVSVKAAGKFYTLERTIKNIACGWKVTDKYTNISNQDMGIAISVDAGSNQLDFLNYKLAGQSGANAVTFFCSANPSMFVVGKKSAVGLAGEDMVSRSQMQMRANGNVLSMATNGTGLPKNSSITREWVLLPVADGKYFTMINALRKEWNLNYTIPGPLNAVNLRNNVYDGLNGKVMFFLPFHFFDKGAGMTDDQYMAMIKPQLDKARKKLPADAYLLGSIETNLVPFDTRTVPWGRELNPRMGKRGKKSGTYGCFLSKELTAKLDAVTPYKDSIIRDRNGNAMVDIFYAEYPFIDLMVQPELGNMRFKRFLEQIDFLMDKVGFNGIYIDQFNPYLIGGFSEDRWDGHSVELAPDGTIRNKIYNYAIAGASARAEIIKYVVKKGGIVLTNGQPMCKEEMIPGRFSFQEMENDEVDPLPFINSKPPEFRWQSISHLGIPIALGLRPCKYDNYNKRPNRCAQILTKGVITALRNGLMTYAYSFDIRTDGKEDSGSYEMFNKMLPLTPVELNEGFIVGKERTVTALSGSYKSAGKARPAVFYFNNRGVPRAGKSTVTGKSGAWDVKIKLDDWNEVAVIEHK